MLAIQTYFSFLSLSVPWWLKQMESASHFSFYLSWQVT